MFYVPDRLEKKKEPTLPPPAGRKEHSLIPLPFEPTLVICRSSVLGVGEKERKGTLPSFLPNSPFMHYPRSLMIGLVYLLLLYSPWFPDSCSLRP